METRTTLHADIPGSVSALTSATKHFELRHKLYRLLLRGKGLEFDGYRDFSVEDDSSLIDWRASKRSNKLLVKQYRDEQNLKVIFLIDVGEHMVFGSSEQLKCEYAAEVTGALAHLVIGSGDKIGYLFFNESVKEYVRPAGGDRHFQRFAQALLSTSTYGGGSDIGKALDYVVQYVPHGVSSVIIVSDFLLFNEHAKNSLRLVSKQFETTAVVVRDPRDTTLPDIKGEFALEDPTTGEQLVVNPHLVGKYYESYMRQQQVLFTSICQESNVDILDLSTDKGFVPTVAEFLRRRTQGGGKRK